MWVMSFTNVVKVATHPTATVSSGWIADRIYIGRSLIATMFQFKFIIRGRRLVILLGKWSDPKKISWTVLLKSTLQMNTTTLFYI